MESSASNHMWVEKKLSELRLSTYGSYSQKPMKLLDAIVTVVRKEAGIVGNSYEESDKTKDKL